MYSQYWGLKEKPFENTPDPKFLFHSTQHDEAISRLFYAIRERKPAAMLTGEYGAGKTLLSRVLMEELTKERYKVALIFNPRMSPLEFLQEIAFQLGEDAVKNDSKRELVNQLGAILNNNFQRFKETVVVIDEAQAIEDLEVFEELRLLLNFQLNNAFLLTLVLLGQPELIRKISALPQFDQRIAIRYHLAHLNEEESRGYILHRLNIAGAPKEKEIFSAESLRLIYQTSAGIPRMINNICDMCLLVGMGRKDSRVDLPVVTEVVKDLEERYTVAQKR
ncbi:MAG: ExeA family protein [Candidatus Omnitrophota bacterium]